MQKTSTEALGIKLVSL